MRHRHRIAIGTVLLVLFAAGGAWAKPGPTVSGFLERTEYHSKTANSNSTEFGNDFYLYSMLFMARQLDTGITGTVAYIHQYGLHDNQTLAHIFNVSLSQKLLPKLKAAYSYSYVGRAGRNASAQFEGNCTADPSGTAFRCPRSNSDWLGIGAEFNSNPDGTRRNTFKSALAYNTTTDFSEDRSIVPKLSYRTKFGARSEGELAYQMIYNLKDIGAAGRQIWAHQYFLTFDVNVGALSKVELQYIFDDNVYDGNPGDDNIIRVNFIHVFKRKR